MKGGQRGARSHRTHILPRACPARLRLRPPTPTKRDPVCEEMVRNERQVDTDESGGRHEEKRLLCRVRGAEAGKHLGEYPEPSGDREVAEQEGANGSLCLSLGRS